MSSNNNLNHHAYFKRSEFSTGSYTDYEGLDLIDSFSFERLGHEQHSDKTQLSKSLCKPHCSSLHRKDVTKSISEILTMVLKIVISVSLHDLFVTLLKCCNKK